MENLFNLANNFFLYYLLIYATFLTISAIYATNKMYNDEKLERLNNKLENKDYYPMSITVPAYNEELTIIDTINNLLKLNYPRFEIIVIDDGSKDNTKNLIINSFNLKKKNMIINYQVKCEEIKEYYKGKRREANYD